MALRLRIGSSRAHSQIGADDKHPPRLFSPCRP
jgi:hypothetical protein